RAGGAPAPGWKGAGPEARQDADRSDQHQDDERARHPVLGKQPEELGIESRAGAAGGGQPVARLAHLLHGLAAAVDGLLLDSRLTLFSWRQGYADRHTHTRNSHVTSGRIWGRTGPDQPEVKCPL